MWRSEGGRKVGCVVKEEGGSERGREKSWGCRKKGEV